MPAQIIEKGIATPGLLTYILVSKFCDAISFYRQEKKFERIEIEFPLGDFCNWAVQTGRKCTPSSRFYLMRYAPVLSFRWMRHGFRS
jgi:transposase